MGEDTRLGNLGAISDGGSDAATPIFGVGERLPYAQRLRLYRVGAIRTKPRIPDWPFYESRLSAANGAYRHDRRNGQIEASIDDEGAIVTTPEPAVFMEVTTDTDVGILKMTPDLSTIWEYTSDNAVTQYQSITADPEGHAYGITFGGQDSPYRIEKVSKNGAGSVWSDTNTSNSIRGPGSIDYSVSESAVYYTDGPTVYKKPADGGPTTQSFTAGDYAKNVSVGPNGNVVVPFFDGARLLDPDLNLLWHKPKSEGDSPTIQPINAKMGPKGDAFVREFANSKIYRYNEAGDVVFEATYSDTIADGLSLETEPMVVTPDGSVISQVESTTVEYGYRYAYWVLSPDFESSTIIGRRENGTGESDYLEGAPGRPGAFPEHYPS